MSSWRERQFFVKHEPAFLTVSVHTLASLDVSCEVTSFLICGGPDFAAHFWAATLEPHHWILGL